VLALDLQDEALHPAPGGVGSGEPSVIVHVLEPIFASAAWASPRTRTTETATLANAFGFGSTTLRAGGHLIKTAAGMSGGLTSSMVSRSARVI
jgi:hypothetical protein